MPSAEAPAHGALAYIAAWNTSKTASAIVGTEGARMSITIAAANPTQASKVSI